MPIEYVPRSKGSAHLRNYKFLNLKSWKLDTPQKVLGDFMLLSHAKKNASVYLEFFIKKKYLTAMTDTATKGIHILGRCGKAARLQCDADGLKSEFTMGDYAS